MCIPLLPRKTLEALKCRLKRVYVWVVDYLVFPIVVTPEMLKRHVTVTRKKGCIVVSTLNRRGRHIDLYRLTLEKEFNPRVPGLAVEMENKEQCVLHIHAWFRFQGTYGITEEVDCLVDCIERIDICPYWIQKGQLYSYRDPTKILISTANHILVEMTTLNPTSVEELPLHTENWSIEYGVPTHLTPEQECYLINRLLSASERVDGHK